MRYSIIIPTYNHLEDCLKPCIESIIKYTDLSDIEIIVVANGCTDDTRTYVEGLGDPFKLIWRDEALGYIKSTNIGIIEAQGEYIILLNNDVILREQEKNTWLKMLQKPFVDKRVGITGPYKDLTIYWKDHRINFRNEFVVFYCAMIRKQVIQDIGLLDESFGLGYEEDVDFCTRANRVGYKIIQVPQDINYDLNITKEYIQTHELRDTSFPVTHLDRMTFKDIVIPSRPSLLLNKYHRPKYSIIIPTYKHLHDCLKPCIESIIRYTDLSNVEVIIVANGCNDGTEEYVRDLGHPFKLLYIKDACGYTKATNDGIKNAQGEYIILLNNDNIILPCSKNAWIRMLENPFSSIPNVAVTGAAKNVHPGTGSEFLLFFCVMIKYDIFNKIGFLDEIFNPGYGEDIDFCNKAVASGYKIIQVPDDCTLEKPRLSHEHTIYFPIWHKGSQTVSTFDGWGEIVPRNEKILKDRYSRKNLKYSIVIPTHNHLDDCLKPCIESIVKNTDLSNVEVIVVANGCTDGTEEFVKSLGSSFKLIQMKEASGYIKPTNEGIKHSKGQYVILLNNDTRVLAPAWLDILVAPFVSDKTGVTGPRKSWRDDIKSEYILFFCAMIRKEVFDKIGLLDEKFGIGYNEDADFCIRAINAGYELVEVPYDIKYSDTNKGTDVREMLFPIHHAGGRTFSSIYESSTAGAANNVHVLYEKHLHNKPMVYDCFMFFNELDVLEIRLNELDAVVDKFVLVEATLTHQGNPKPLYFDENKKRFEKFLHKIEHIIVDDFPPTEDPWVREPYQRNCIMRGLHSCKPDDVIIVSDVDEIPKASVVESYQKEMGLCCIQTSLFYYKLNYLCDVKWYKCRIFTFSELDGADIQQVRGRRDYEYKTIIENGGWHFSFLGNKEHIRQKIESYGHVEYNNTIIKSDDNIQTAINEGKDIFRRSEVVFKKIPIDSSFPMHVIVNKERYKKMGLIACCEIAYEELRSTLKKEDADMYKEVYEELDVYRMKSSDLKDKIIVDIGGYYGAFSFRAMELGARKAYCYEPQPDNYIKLKSLVGNFNLQDNVDVNNLAVLDGSVTNVTISCEKMSSSIWSTKNTVTVPCVSLEAVYESIKEKGNELVLKLDCEGSEFDIILNTPEKVVRMFSLIYMEIHKDPNPKYKDKVNYLIEHMRQIGYIDEEYGPAAGMFYKDGSFVPFATTVKFRRVVQKLDELFIQKCISLAEKNISGIESSVLDINGMATASIRHLINNLLSKEGLTYLEVGLWKGSTACSAMSNNNLKQAVFFENFSEFIPNNDLQNHRAELIANLRKFSSNNKFDLIEQDFFSSDLAGLSGVDVFLYDGLHTEAAQSMALVKALPCLSDVFVFIVDDYMWPSVEKGTTGAVNALIEAGSIEKLHEVILSSESAPKEYWPNGWQDGFVNYTTPWRNGIYIGLFKKTVNTSKNKTTKQYINYSNSLCAQNHKSGMDKPKIYDCFSFFNELDLLEIRLHELDPYVDYFVLSEMTVTHSGKPKALCFADNKQRFAKFLHKIVHIIVDDCPITSDPWTREHHQRDALSRGLQSCKDSDIIIVSDIDEIPRGEKIKEFDLSKHIMFFEQNQYNYYLNMNVGISSIAPGVFSRITTYGYMKSKNTSATAVRYCNLNDAYAIRMGGWHFSWMGGSKKIVEKLESWAHQEFNQTKYKNQDLIEKNIDSCKEAMGRENAPHKPMLVNVDSSFPKYIIDNYEKLLEIKLIKDIAVSDRVAIIMPYHNDKFLHQAVIGILNQTYTSWKLFIIDDGSDFGMRARDVLGANLPNRIQIIEQDNRGVSSARNKALDLIRQDSTYAYIAYCDSDDIWNENYLESQLKCLNNCDLAYAIPKHKFDNGMDALPYGIPNPPQYPGLDFMIKSAFIYISGVVHKRACMAVGDFDVRLDSIEDWDMWVRVAKAGYKIQKNDDTSFTYTVKTKGNMASKRTAEKADIFYNKHKL